MRALIAVDDSEEAISVDFFGKSHIAQSEWASIAAIGGAGKKTDRDQGDRFAALPSLTGARQIDCYIEIFCTKTSGPRENVFTGDIRKQHGTLCERLHEERDRIWNLIERRRAVAARERTIALVTVAKAVLDRFNAEKNRRGLLDFEDQIDKTHELLARDSAAWIHYKLDRGIDHVLIDEAQDTSPKQWGIVRHLVAEFFAGKGASEKKRTIFAVGDNSQFSRSRAPLGGIRACGASSKSYPAAATSLRHVPSIPLWSGANVLSAVDSCSSQLTWPPASRMTLQVFQTHRLGEATPGDVEIWDTEKPLDDGGEQDPWNAPFDQLTGSKPAYG